MPMRILYDIFFSHLFINIVIKVIEIYGGIYYGK